MTTNDLASEIRSLLLESPRVEEVLQLRVPVTADGVLMAGVQVSLVDIQHCADLPPVLAELRALIRQLVPSGTPVFIEPDLTGRPRENVTTEAVVIRSAD